MTSNSLPTHTEDDHDDNCLDVITSAVEGQQGIVQVTLDTYSEKVAFDYDPARISPGEIETLAGELAPTLRYRFDNCTLRLSKQGGRACEVCAARLEQNLAGIPGVQRATASYLGGALSVSYDAQLLSPDDILHHVQQLGVAAEPSAAAIAPAAEPSPAWMTRLRGWLTSEYLAAILTGVTLVTMLTGLAAEWQEADGLATVMYVIAYVAGGVFGVQAGLESLREYTVDVDLLMILAALGAAIIGAPFEGAMLLFLFSLSNVLQDFALDRTRSAIQALMKLRPNQALVRRGGQTGILPLEQIVVGDVMIIRPGERVPLDGEVIAGQSTLDQSPLTGESMPVAKQVGDGVLSGTINQNGSLDVRVTHLAGDSTIARLIQMVEEAQSTKANTQRFIDRFEQYYAAGVIVMTVAALVIPLLFLGEAFQPALYRAMTLMVAASPCALVISTPATILSAIGNGARRGVLFKGGVHMEQAATIKVVAFDKTGTLTEGKPRVTDIVPLNGGDESAVLALAAAVEAKSEHPLAGAIVAATDERGLTLAEASDFQAITSQGAQGTVDGQLIYVGRLRYLSDYACDHRSETEQQLARLQQDGKTSVVVAELDQSNLAAALLGVIGIADTLRPAAPAIIRDLKRLGVAHVVMLTGDNERVAQAIAAQAGVDEFHASLMPADKVARVRDIQAKYGPVAMVGDGVNDAPALAVATLGVAMGAAGTDVALETADVVLMADDLANIPYFIALSRQARKTMLANLAFASGVIVVLIASVLGLNLALPLSVVGHEGSTVLVSLNGLRLLGYRWRGTTPPSDSNSTV